MLEITALDHVVLNVADVERSLQFYRDLLGMASEREAAYRSGEVKFPSVRVSAETIIDLFPPAMHRGVAIGENMNHLCLVASGTPQEVRTHLESAGAPILEGPVEVFGARGTGVSYYTRDPDGTKIELRSYAT